MRANDNEASPDTPKQIAAATGLLPEAISDKFPVPDVQVAEEDPFAKDDIVDKLAASFKGCPVGVALYQIYPTRQHASLARSLMGKVSKRLGWKAYKTKEDGCILWVKRLK